MVQFEKPAKDSEVIVMETSVGTIKLCLFPGLVPKTVENFVTHAKNGYYNGVSFHRVINGFMIQGGDPAGNGTGGESIWGKSFDDEFSSELHNFRGALSMANSGPNTNGSQFFIVQADKADKGLLSQMKEIGLTPDGKGFSEEVIEKYQEIGGTPWLDYKHAVFGQVFEGMDVVDAIAATEHSEEKVVMKTVSVELAEKHIA